MADLESLLNDLANFDAQMDFEGLRRVREQIVAEHEESEHAVEATYKLGLDFLFRQRDMRAAVEAFSTAAKRKHPFWSPAARTSLGLCFYHQKKTQKALFELRRVAYMDPPNAHSVTALAFMENIFATEGNADEIAKVRKDKVSQLRAVIAATDDAASRAYHQLQLGITLKDQGDDKAGNEILEELKGKGPSVLGADLYRSVVDALV